MESDTIFGQDFVDIRILREDSILHSGIFSWLRIRRQPNSFRGIECLFDLINFLNVSVIHEDM